MNKPNDNKVGRIFNIMAVKDELTGIFLTPMFMETNREAMRWFKFIVNDTPMWTANAAMYSLFKIGTFDESKGIIEMGDPELIAGGLSVLEVTK